MPCQHRTVCLLVRCLLLRVARDAFHGSLAAVAGRTRRVPRFSRRCCRSHETRSTVLSPLLRVARDAFHGSLATVAGRTRRVPRFSRRCCRSHDTRSTVLSPLLQVARHAFHGSLAAVAGRTRRVPRFSRRCCGSHETRSTVLSPLLQVARDALEGAVAAAAAVDPAERRAGVPHQRDVHHGHQAIPVRGAVEERRVGGRSRLPALARHLPRVARHLQAPPEDADRGASRSVRIARGFLLKPN